MTYPNPFSLEGKHILVTGASSGIGREVAVWLSSQGARITLVARDQQRLEETQRRLIGENHSIAAVDFLTTVDVSAWMKSLAKQSAPFDGLVHAAGIQAPMPIRATSLSHWEKVMATNVTSSFSLIKAFRQKGVCQSSSSIVLISSVMAKAGEPALLGYCASKGAVESMVRAASIELAREGIRVNCVAPGVVRTEMADSLKDLVGADSMELIERKHPLGFGTPLDVAYAVNYLLSPAARWVTGTSLVVDGGYLA
ncbi:SDR family NAD(P)-dependent oxidoreductase [Pseudomonas sessilinigenes]|uniref:SDR family oxidoreductase n=1 Tax=Pseudomonas sessilinigenes TaxID=658629 RepID=A0ABX8MJ80_9PSED|nr:SDR family oxidoreductase [Pseudomonas sessilinigenes]AZC27861.1 Oxidoreductase, short-chain dehydrogenase/reductase family [Pseudomonas sessilinigenes]QXH38263.1 SDR family oxidoreductase [Pseudomonas sessilinigenes]